MTASAKANLVVELTGLNKNIQYPISWSTTSTPTMFAYGRQVQTTADVAEALNLGDVTTPKLVVIECITNDVDLDCNYSSSFSADITVNEGEAAVFCPAGTVYIKNNDSEEASTFDYFIIGI